MKLTTYSCAEEGVASSGLEEMYEKTFEVTKTIFDAMEAVLHSPLSELTRASIVKVLKEFEQECRLVARAKEKLARAKEQTALAADFAKARRKIQQKHGRILREAAADSSDLSAAVRALEQIQERETGRKPSPDYVRVWKLL